MKQTIWVLLCFLTATNAWCASWSGVSFKSGGPQKVELKKAHKASVLLFLSSKCPCSKGQIDHLNQLAKRFGDFQFVGVNSNQDEPFLKAKKYFDKLSEVLHFPVIRDPKASLANRFGALKTPHVFVVDRRGEVVFEGGVANRRKISAATKLYLKEALEALSAGKPAPVKVAKTLGCYIKR